MTAILPTLATHCLAEAPAINIRHIDSQDLELWGSLCGAQLVAAILALIGRLSWPDLAPLGWRGRDKEPGHLKHEK